MLRLEQVLEVGCLVGLSSLLAVGLSLPVSEWFAASGIIQEPVTFASCRTLYIATVGGAWLVGMAAGLYPAYFVTSFPTALLLKGNYGLTPSGRKIKSGLLVLQYAIACSLLVFIAFVFLQNRMMMRSNTNFDQDQLAIVQLTSEMVEKQGTWCGLCDRMCGRTGFLFEVEHGMERRKDKYLSDLVFPEFLRCDGNQDCRRTQFYR